MKSLGKDRRFGVGWLRCVLLAAALVGSVGCANAAKQLRLAQDAFNQGAALENEARLGDLVHPSQFGAPPILEERQPDVYYRQALTELKGINEKQLQKDGLLATKMTIEALCQWKLQQASQANAIVAGAKQLADITQTPRDHIILTLLPGLIKNDQAYEKYTDPNAGAQTLPIVEDLLIGPQGAIHHMQEAKQLAQGQPIEVYVLQAYLSLYKNLMEARVTLQRQTLTDSEKQAVAALLDALSQATHAHGLSEEQNNAWLTAWRTAIPTD